MIERITSLFVLSVLLLFSSINAVAQDNVDSYIAAIEGIQPQSSERLGNFTIEELLIELDVPGVSIAIVKDFDIHWAKGYGAADIVSGDRVDTETRFQAASISKAVNAMAVVRAAQDGLIDLDADINTYLKSWKLRSDLTEGTPVTPLMLASHTAGLGDGFGFPGYVPGSQIPTVVQILNGAEPSNTGPVRMARPPSTAYHYSGGGSTILQLALIDIYNQPYEDILAANILKPLGMTNSAFEQPLSDANSANAARAHSTSVEPYKWKVYPELAAAGLWTTPTDLAKMVIDTQLSLVGKSNKILSRESIQLMLSPVGIGPYAAGYTILKHGEGWYFGHGGSNYGFRSNIAAHKIKGYGYVVMTNSSKGQALISELGRRIQEVYAWDSLDRPVRR